MEYELKYNEWLSLKMIKDPDKGINGYVYSHETRCHGEIISMLPFRFEKHPVSGYFDKRYLLRDELTPCWSIDNKVVSSITGGRDEGDSIEDTVIKELREEAGYIVKIEDLLHLGTCYGAKSSDTIYHLFSMNLTTKSRIEAVGDGSQLEAEGSCFWSDSIMESRDPLTYIAYTRLLQLSGESID